MSSRGLAPTSWPLSEIEPRVLIAGFVSEAEGGNHAYSVDRLCRSRFPGGCATSGRTARARSIACTGRGASRCVGHPGQRPDGARGGRSARRAGGAHCLPRRDPRRCRPALRGAGAGLDPGDHAGDAEHDVAQRGVRVELPGRSLEPHLFQRQPVERYLGPDHLPQVDRLVQPLVCCRGIGGGEPARACALQHRSRCDRRSVRSLQRHVRHVGVRLLAADRGWRGPVPVVGGVGVQPDRHRLLVQRAPDLDQHHRVPAQNTKPGRLGLGRQPDRQVQRLDRFRVQIRRR